MKVKFNDLFNNLINVIYGSLVIIGILGAANRLLGVFTNNLSSKDVLILDVIAIIGILIFKFRKKNSNEENFNFVRNIVSCMADVYRENMFWV